MSQPTVMERLGILADAAKYDDADHARVAAGEQERSRE